MAAALHAPLIVWDRQAPTTPAGPAGVQRLPALHIECEAFTGPLALLVECARLRKIDLADIPVFPICRAYVEYLLEPGEHQEEALAGALTVLAYLIERKAWSLLPSPPAEKEPDGTEAEALALPSLGEFAELIAWLSGRREEGSDTFFRATGRAAYALPMDLADVTVDDLARSLAQVMERSRPIDPILARPRRSIAATMECVEAALQPGYLTLAQLMPEGETREETVWWFLALLELIRLGRAVVIVEEEVARFACA